jgi:hypothetical protein
MQKQATAPRAPRRRFEEHSVGHCAHSGDLQQHDRHHHRCAGELCLVVQRGQAHGFKGSRKSTPFAAQLAAEDAAREAQEHGMRSMAIFVKGPGAGREAALRAFQTAGSASPTFATSPPFRTTVAVRPSAGASEKQKEAPTWPGTSDRSAASVGAKASSSSSRASVATPRSAHSTAARTRLASTARAHASERLRRAAS